MISYYAKLSQEKHVPTINNVPSKFLLTFNEPQKYKTDFNLIISHHPFFKTSFCLVHLLLYILTVLMPLSIAIFI